VPVYLLASLPAARADTPRDELLRLVPDDVSLCVIVNDLRGQTQRLLAAPWLKQAVNSPAGKALLASPDLRPLTRLDEDLQKGLQVTVARLRDDIFGDLVVLAFRHDPSAKAGQEDGLLLLRARDADLLVKLEERLNRVQRRSGELKALEERTYKGVRYHRRQDVRGEHFYLIRGPILAFAAREATLRQVIDRQLERDGARANLVRRLRCLDGAFVGLWLNPRAFDKDLRRKEADGSASEARVLRAFRSYWQALDGIGLALAVGRDVELRLSLQGRMEALPAAGKRLAEAAAGPSDLWGRFPPDAVITSVSRTDFAALGKVVAEFLPAEQRDAVQAVLQGSLGATLGLDLDEILPRLGPDHGYCVAEAPDGTGFPHVLFALRIQPGPADSPVDQALYKAVQLAAGWAVVQHNLTQKGTLRLKDFRQGAVRGKYLTGDPSLPAGLEPAFALKGGYLVLASAPAALERFGAKPATTPVKREVLLFRLSCKRLAGLLESRRDAVVSYLAEKNQVPAEMAGGWLDGALQVLRLVERVDGTQRVEAGQVTWTVRVRLVP
jgi:hypothetical protein